MKTQIESSVFSGIIERLIFISIMTISINMTSYSQSVYVDSNTGDDNNSGTREAPVYSIKRASEIIRSMDNDIYTMKINPGVYILDSHISVATEKEIAGKRIVIEASILPDDPTWAPEKMPVITSRALKGGITYSPHWVVSFLVEESHVTIRGIKFHGYFYPYARYFPVARIDETKTDLSIEQCLFVGETNSSQIQAIFAHGNEVKIDHCVFYKVRNTVVLGYGPDKGSRSGCSFTNTIVYGSNQAIWTSGADKDFRFENNIISNCRYAWVKGTTNTTKYSLDNCIIVDNLYYQGIPDSIRLVPGVFKVLENNVQKNGEISLRIIDNEEKPLLLGIDGPLPIDYLHVIPGTPGYEMGAGLFLKKTEYY